MRSKCALESRPYSRDNGLERTEKLSRMVRLLQPTEPRPPCCATCLFKARFTRVSLAVFGHGSRIAPLWIAHGSLLVRSRYARSTVGVCFKYGVGTVPLQFGTSTFFGPVLYTQTSNSLHASVRFIVCNRKQ